ncbi:unnamed protein product [Ostreobium quekettii]|uniref:Uncharacterized protein n=1 Tax=Ostreobium quekettii TaxID=121088 RepID=A0A8S1JFD4_9CHLO|nr:unnamed protein product [Ostreobium quekettii]
MGKIDWRKFAKANPAGDDLPPLELDGEEDAGSESDEIAAASSPEESKPGRKRKRRITARAVRAAGRRKRPHTGVLKRLVANAHWHHIRMEAVEGLGGATKEWGVRLRPWLLHASGKGPGALRREALSVAGKARKGICLSLMRQVAATYGLELQQAESEEGQQVDGPGLEVLTIVVNPLPRTAHLKD